MASTGGGFLVGFFFAILIFSCLMYYMLTPYSPQISTMYQATQSSWYSTAINFLNGLKGVASNPIISALTGGVSGGAANMIGGISDFMVQSKMTISILYNFMVYSIPMMIVSVIMILVGAAVISKSGKSEKREKKSKHCPKCGAKLEDDSRFCPACGKKV
jgi:ribosomal protein S27AE